MRERGLVLVVAAAFSGCTTLPPTGSPVGAPTPTPVPGSSVAAPSACDPSQIELAPGRMGAAAGTFYLTITALLAAGPACLVRVWPSIEIDSPVAGQIDAGGPAGDSGAGRQTTLLGTKREFRIGWASWCGPDPSGPLSARIAFVDNEHPTLLSLPAGFGPSGCNGSDSVLFVEPGFDP